MTLPFKFMYNEKFFGKVGELKSRFLHENLCFFHPCFFLAPVYVRGASFPAVSAHFGYAQTKRRPKNLHRPLPQAVSQTTILILYGYTEPRINFGYPNVPNGSADLRDKFDVR